MTSRFDATTITTCGYFWAEAVGRVADALGGIRDEHGPDAIAGLASSRVG